MDKKRATNTDAAKEFEKLTAKLAKRAEELGLKESDVEEIVHRSRGIKTKGEEAEKN